MSHITKLVSSLAIFTLLAVVVAPAQKSEHQKQAEQQLKAEKAEERAEQKRADALLSEQVQKLAEQQNWPVKIFDIKQANALDVRRLLDTVFRGQVKDDVAQQTLVVRAPKELMPAIEDIVKRFDAPPAPLKNVELTAYMLVAEKAESNVKLPAELAPVVKQLKSVFSYQGFRLLDTLVLRSREGREAEVSGVAPSSSSLDADPAHFGSGRPMVYQFKFRSVRVTSDVKGHQIWIDGMRLGARVPVAVETGGNKQWNYMDIGIYSDVDVREGQKVVVGKANIEGADKPLFLVLTAKVVD